MNQTNKYNLNFISDEDLFNHVLETVSAYSFEMDSRKFNSNFIDPAKLFLDSIFHKNILNYFSDEWIIHKEGYDIENPTQNIYVKIVNQHKTINSPSSANIYMRFQNTIINDPQATCLLVEIIAKNSQNIPWVVTLNKHKQSPIENMRRVSIDSFYEMVTGDKLAFQKLCHILPNVIKDAVNTLETSNK